MGAKRIFDIICAGFGLLILAPFFIIITCLLACTSRGPILFCQTRVGRYERLFTIYKFRTMVVNAQLEGLKITVGADPRITRIGRVLRKTKLDELPQLINVLLGQMSLVGPRPEVPEYIKYYPQDLRVLIFQVRPGITDLASLEMIDENEILSLSANPQEKYITEILPAKLTFAASYVATRTFWGDVGLIFRTIIKIFTR